MPMLTGHASRTPISVPAFEKAFGESHPSINYGQQHQGTRMQIFVKGISGKTFCYSVYTNDTVGSLKTKIYVHNGVPPCDQRLIFAGQQLEDDGTLSSYRVERDSTLHLMQRLCGD